VTYLSFVVSNRRLLAFGFAMAFFSGFGQTYFIALFNNDLRSLFGLGHGGLGTIYGLATLTSAALMLPAGQLIDRVGLRLYAGLVAAGIAAACLFMSAVPAGSLAFLYLALLFLRFAGQGLMSHVSATAMARHFVRGRGRALSLASLGFAGAEMVLPPVAVALVALVGWRQTWSLIGMALALGLVPLVLWLLRGHDADCAAGSGRSADPAAAVRHWSRAEVLRDPVFFLLLPALLTPAFVNTGVFFNQTTLVEAKGWTLSLFAAGFTVFAVATVAAALGTGFLVDRSGGLRVFGVVLLPLAAGLAVLGTLRDPATIFVYMALAGCSMGAFNTTSNALLAEVYGTGHLGAIRSVGMSLMVLSTAVSPAAMGWLLDAGVRIETILFMFLAWVAVATALVPLAARRVHARGTS
jgi:MFS family permease